MERSWVRISFLPIIDGNDIKAMPGWDPAPNLGSFTKERRYFQPNVANHNKLF